MPNPKKPQLIPKARKNILSNAIDAFSAEKKKAKVSCGEKGKTEDVGCEKYGGFVNQCQIRRKKKSRKVKSKIDKMTVKQVKCENMCRSSKKKKQNAKS